MRYRETIRLKNGKEALLRNGDKADGDVVYDIFTRTHAETDYLLSYPDENSFSVEEEGEFLHEKTESDREIEIIALVDERVVGTAGIEQVGKKYKVGTGRISGSAF